MKANVRTLNDFTAEDLRGQRVFVRVDFNVPLDENLNVTDDRRIRSALPTINYAIDEGSKVILASHLGRPKGKADKRYSLASVARRLQRLIKKDGNGSVSRIESLQHPVAFMRQFT